jgi:2,4-dienoyl-CoA reductase (NADPH2)
VLFEARDELGGQFDMARVIPGKEEFDETLRYFRVRLADAGVEVRLGTKADTATLKAESFDVVILATGVKPRELSMPGIDHDSVLSYPDVLRDGAEVGERVAIIGAGGIGFDVAEFLTERRAKRAHPDITTFMAEWGVDKDGWGTDDGAARGGLRERAQASPARQVHLLQRKKTKHGAGLGKTTGWIHRASLKHRGVNFLGGVKYVKVDDAGLHIEVDGEPQVLAVDNVVVCAGQVSEDGLAAPLRDAGFTVHVVGGADEAAELDAKRAIRQGAEVAAAL